MLQSLIHAAVPFTSVSASNTSIPAMHLAHQSLPLHHSPVKMLVGHSHAHTRIHAGIKHLGGKVSHSGYESQKRNAQLWSLTRQIYIPWLQDAHCWVGALIYALYWATVCVLLTSGCMFQVLTLGRICLGLAWADLIWGLRITFCAWSNVHVFQDNDHACIRVHVFSNICFQVHMTLRKTAHLHMKSKHNRSCTCSADAIDTHIDSGWGQHSSTQHYACMLE